MGRDVIGRRMSRRPCGDRVSLLPVGGLGTVPHAPGPPRVRTAQHRGRVDQRKSGRDRIGIPAMCFQAAQNLVGQPDRAQGVLAADPGTR